MDNSFIPKAFELQNALDYITPLLEFPPPLPVSADDVSNMRLQADLGPVAAILLDVLITSLRPRRVLEIGTCLGYSTCAMAKALKPCGGKIATIEIKEDLARLARQNIRTLGLEDTVEVIVGDANQVVKTLHGPYELILQDGHKPDYAPMLADLVNRLAPGGLLISDDVLFPVMDLPEHAQKWQQPIQQYNRLLQSHPQLKTVWLPIGDGIALSVKKIAATPPRQTISSGSPWEKSIGFSRAVRVGNIIAVSGTAPIAADGSTAYPGDVYRQSRHCIEIIRAAIEPAGATLENVIRTRIMLTDIGKWQDAAKAHGEFFAEIKPACTFVEVKGFINSDWLVEIEADCIL